MKVARFKESLGRKEIAAMSLALVGVALIFAMPPKMPEFDLPDMAESSESSEREKPEAIHTVSFPELMEGDLFDNGNAGSSYAIGWNGFTTDGLKWDGITYENTQVGPGPEPDPDPVPPPAEAVGMCQITDDGSDTTLVQNVHTWIIEGVGHTIGNYVLGECWIQGPVRILSVSPAPYSESNGSVVNGFGGKTAGQGFEGGASTYQPELRIVYPYDAAVSSSIISSITDPTLGDDGTTNTRAGWVQGLSVLTVTQVAPIDGDFRPPYSGGNKLSEFNFNDMDLSHIPTIAAVGTDIPTYEIFSNMMNRPWWDGTFEWVARASHPELNMPAYGANMTSTVSAACLATTLDFTPTQRATLAAHMIQVGIDNFGLINAGHYWPANGGHASGRIAPILFAGKAFNRQDMLDVGLIDNPISSIFGENCQSFFNTDIGAYDYSIRWCTREIVTGVVNAKYQSVNLPTWVGQTMCARMIGVASDWNHDSLFGVVDRYSKDEMALPFGSKYGPYDIWAYEMWLQYSSQYPYNFL